MLILAGEEVQLHDWLFSVYFVLVVSAEIKKKTTQVRIARNPCGLKFILHLIHDAVLPGTKDEAL